MMVFSAFRAVGTDPANTWRGLTCCERSHEIPV